MRYKVSFIVVIIFALCSLGLSSTSAAADMLEFKVYDELLSKGIVGKPSIIGGLPIHVVYQWQGYGGVRISDKDYTGPVIYDYLSGSGYTDTRGLYHEGIGYPDDVAIRSDYSDDVGVVDRNFTGLISIDFETWKIYDSAVDWPQAKNGYLEHPSRTIQDTLTKTLEAVAAVRKAFPKAKIAWYNLANPGFPVSAFPDAPDGYIKGMQTINDYYQPVIDVVDVLTPSMYYTATKGDRRTPLTFNSFLKKMDMILDEQKRISNGKPIIPFISPFVMDKYPDTSGHISLVPLSDWELQLTALKKRVNGVIIWCKPNPVFDGWAEVEPYWRIAVDKQLIAEPIESLSAPSKLKIIEPQTAD